MRRITPTITIILLICFSANAQSQFDRGFVREGIYINPGFGFQFKYPAGWTVHGDATSQRIREVGKQEIVNSGALSEASAEASMKHSLDLLTVFRHPLGTPGITFNPAILVLAERIDHAPGIKNGKDYLLNVRALLQKAGKQVPQEDPTEHRFAEWQFFRDDLVTESNGVEVSQALFASVARGYAVLFMFMGENRKSVDEMAKSMETFAFSPPVRRGATTAPVSPTKPKPRMKH